MDLRLRFRIPSAVQVTVAGVYCLVAFIVGIGVMLLLHRAPRPVAPTSRSGIPGSSSGKVLPLNDLGLQQSPASLGSPGFGTPQRSGSVHSAPRPSADAAGAVKDAAKEAAQEAVTRCGALVWGHRTKRTLMALMQYTWTIIIALALHTFLLFVWLALTRPRLAMDRSSSLKYKHWDLVGYLWLYAVATVVLAIAVCLTTRQAVYFGEDCC